MKHISKLAKLSFVCVLVPLLLIVSGQRTLADQTPIVVKLFDAIPTFRTGPLTSIGEAVPFASTSILLDFKADDSAVLSSTPDGTGPIIIDNFMTINGENICGENCFGPHIRRLRDDRPIDTILEPIPPIDVSAFIPVGLNSILFELRDFGVIAGNTELFLVTTASPGVEPIKFDCPRFSKTCSCEGFFDCKALERSRCCQSPIDICRGEKGSSEICTCPKSPRCG